jgi:hypothetical protein
MHYMAPVESNTFHWFAQPCRDAFAVLQRRLGYSPPTIQPARAGCRIEFERRGTVVAVTYWLGLPPVVEIVHPDAELRSRFEFPYLPPRTLPRAVASLHARLRLAPPCFAQSDEALTEQLVTSRERPGLARALRLHLRVLAADLLRRHRGKLAPERRRNQRSSTPSQTSTTLRPAGSSVSVRSRVGSPSASMRIV